MSEIALKIKNAELSAKARWLILILVSITIATNYYVYDAMSSIKALMQSELGFSNADYGLLVSFYSFPNTFLFMSIIGGIILDKWGIIKTGYMFVGMCVVGIFISAYGATEYYHNQGFGYSLMNSFLNDYSPELKMLMLGRLLFGLGAETSIVVINKIMAKWFKGKELALAFAVNIAIARIGTAAALIFSPIIAGDGSAWQNALWIAALLMGIGLLCFIFYSIYDKKYSLPKIPVSGSKQQSASETKDPSDEFRFADIISLLTNKSFIFICLLCVTFYSAVFPFQAYCADFLHNKFSVSLEMSGILSSVIIWGTIVFTPLFGWTVDKKGKRASLMFIGSILLFGSHLLLALTYLTPYIPMFILGIAFSLVPAAMWPSVALIVEEKKLGTAYGIMASIQNLGLWGFPILAGYLLDVTNPAVNGVAPKVLDYQWTMIMFAALGIIGFLFAYLLKREDSKQTGYGLEKPSL